MIRPVSQIHALRDVASLINTGSDVDTVLQHLLLAACRHAGWSMGSIMGVDQDSGFGHVICRYDPSPLRRELLDRWELASSPAMVALTRNEPVFIADVRRSDEFPGYRKDALDRDYNSLLVVPMACRDPYGRAMVLNLISRELVSVDEEQLAFVGAIAHLGAIAVEKQYRLVAEQTGAEGLRRALQTHTNFLAQALSKPDVGSLTLEIGHSVNSPIVVVDLTAGVVLAGRSPNPALFDDASWRVHAVSTFRETLLRAARDVAVAGASPSPLLLLDHGNERFRISPRIEPLIVDGEAVGALIVFPSANDAGDLDQMLIESACFALSVYLLRSFTRFQFESRSLSQLFGEIVEGRWEDGDDLRRRASRLGIAIDEPCQLWLVEPSASAGASPAMLSERQQAMLRACQQDGLAGRVVRYRDGVVCIVPQSEQAGKRTAATAKRVLAAVDAGGGGGSLMVMSKVCSGSEGLAAAWRHCHRLAGIARSFGRDGLIEGGDYGALPMLAAAVEMSEVRNFVNGSIGAIAAHDRAHGTPYLTTLTTYLREGCRNQACADVMGLHVTTLRYRLGRIQELFGVDVESPDRRFSFELAINLHRIASQAD